MPDMLVKLYALPPLEPEFEAMRRAGVVVRRGRSYELTRVGDFVTSAFAPAWADEISVGFARQPVSVFIAVHEGEVVGFAGVECTARGFLGPMGVSERFRGKAVGRALLIAGLHAMRELGYGYAIIGAAGPTDFYARTVGATIIEGSVPGIYGDALKKNVAGW